MLHKHLIICVSCIVRFVNSLAKDVNNLKAEIVETTFVFLTLRHIVVVFVYKSRFFSFLVAPGRDIRNIPREVPYNKLTIYSNRSVRKLYYWYNFFAVNMSFLIHCDFITFKARIIYCILFWMSHKTNLANQRLEIHKNFWILHALLSTCTCHKCYNLKLFYVFLM